MSKGLTDIATRHQIILEKLKSGKVKDFRLIATALEKEFIAETLKLNVVSLDQLTKKELAIVINNFKAINYVYQVQLTESLMFDLKDLAADEALFEKKTLNKVIRGNTKVKSAADVAFQKATSTPITATGDLLDPFIKNWSATRIKQVEAVVRNAYKEGLTLSQMTQRIRGTKANNYKDGLTNLSTRQAEAVARTSIQHVSATSRASTWEANKDIVIGERWVSTLDSKTTPVCQSLDGREFKLQQGPRPPIHIGCRSTTVPIIDPKLELDFLEEGATRSAYGGEVPAKQTYFDWLKNQPREFQNEAIGKGKASLLNDGTLTSEQFGKLNMSKNFKPISLEDMKAKRDLIINGK